MFSVANNQYEPISVNDEARTSLNWANVAEEVNFLKTAWYKQWLIKHVITTKLVEC